MDRGPFSCYTCSRVALRTIEGLLTCHRPTFSFSSAACAPARSTVSSRRPRSPGTRGCRGDGVRGLGRGPLLQRGHRRRRSIPAVEALRDAAGRADALLILTPEYNGTIPAVLKNAIDWISRPYGTGAVKGKPVAVISASPSGNGAQWAHEDTRKAVRIAGGKVLEDVTLAIGGTIDKFGDRHPRENAEVAQQVADVVASLVDATKQLVDA